MTVSELKRVLNNAEPDDLVKICVNTPAGWVCPDGCAVDIKAAHHGIDWHMCEILIVPAFSLDIHNSKNWEKNIESDKMESHSPSTGSSIINMEYVDIDHILKVGRDFQNTDTWRGAHYDTVKMLCDTIEYLRDKCEKEKTK